MQAVCFVNILFVFICFQCRFYLFTVSLNYLRIQLSFGVHAVLDI